MRARIAHARDELAMLEKVLVRSEPPMMSARNTSDATNPRPDVVRRCFGEHALL
jgi:hypothetical protein